MTTADQQDFLFLPEGSEMTQRIRAYDWSSSPLGLPSNWPDSLRRIVRMILSTKFPMFVVWGDSLSCIYNDAFIPVLGERHPAALGRPDKEIWPDVREVVDPLLARALSGESVYYEDHPLVMLRDGQPHQMWFTFSYSPAYDDDGHICGMFCIASDTTKTVLAQLRLQENEQKLGELARTLEQQVTQRTRERDQIWRNSPDLLLIIDGQGILQSINPAWKAVLGYESEDLVGKSFQPFVHPNDIGPTFSAIVTASQRPLVNFEVRIAHKHGGYRWFAWTAAHEEHLIYANGRDITQLKEQAAMLRHTEEALHQAQKMETVGQLTGGIAHDFNNLLAAMSGNLELMEFRLKQGRTGDLLPYISAAMGVVDRAASLTHRLLAFSRRQTLSPQSTNVNSLVTSMEGLIRQTTGAAIRIDTVLSPDIWNVLLDAHQLESTILNLSINARDAMPSGGELIIETSNVRLDNLYMARHHGATTGDFVLISVTDSGTGMSADVRDRVFEPFFTTKPIGQGTGLGLSMVYGFVKQSGGSIQVYSELGAGTTVKMYLPRDSNDQSLAAAETVMAAPKPVDSGNATILVVEDEQTVRFLLGEMLRELQFDVFEAETGLDALRVLQSSHAIDLLITDVGLPGGMDGRQLAQAARILHPDLDVLFITGYAENAAVRNGLLEKGMEVMTKPFNMQTFVAKVSRMLDK